MKKNNLILFILLTIFKITIQNQTISWDKYVKNKILKATDQEIDSLKGIEKYSFITNLDLSSNQIETIDELKYFESLIELDLANKLIA